MSKKSPMLPSNKKKSEKLTGWVVISCELRCPLEARQLFGLSFVDVGYQVDKRHCES